MKKDTEMTLWISRWQLKTLPEKLAEVVKGTPFEGTKLVFTGNYGKRFYSRQEGRFYPARYQFAVLPTVESYEPIPGFELAGFVRTEDNGKHYSLNSLKAGFEFTKEIADSLDPLRCDVCNTRRVRTRQFLLVEKETGKLIVVGGSCAKNFRGVDLEKTLKVALGLVATISKGFEEELGGWGGGYRNPPLSFGIALAETIVKAFGYVSKKESERTEDPSTSYWVSTYYRQRLDRRFDDQDWERIHTLVENHSEEIYSRAAQLADTRFAELVDYAQAQLDRKWSDFNNNVLAWLTGRDEIKSFGIVAYLGSLKGRIEENLKREESRKKADSEKLPSKGFDGPLNKMADWGEFRVVSVKAKENDWGFFYGFLCVRETEGTSEKVWFKVNESSAAFRAWEKRVGPDTTLPRDCAVYVTLRGKLNKIQSEISFGGNVKFQNVRMEK